MNRGRRQENIFLEDDDYRLFLSVLQEASKQWNLQVAAYCLMSNHYHILIQTPEGNISRCMRHLNGVYTQRFNRKHGTDGPLFRGRYKAILVEEDSHLLELLRYIHRNPIKANITPSLESYPWSSHKGYLAGNRGWSWLHREPLLQMFSRNRKQAYAAYLKFVQQQNSEEIETFYTKQKLSPVFGTAGFVETIKNLFSHTIREHEIPETRIFTASYPEIVKAVCHVCQVTEEELHRSRRGHSNDARDLLIYSMRQHSRQTLSQIGTHLGIEKYSTVSSAVQRIKRELASNKELQILTKEIDKKLSRSQGQTCPLFSFYPLIKYLDEGISVR